MAYKYGQFVWFELVTPNPDDGTAFWTEVAGLGARTADMPTGPYTMLTSGDKRVGGVVAPRMDGVPPHFSSYLSVADVEKASAAVKANGGQVLVPATDIGMGIFAVVKDPEGATFQLWHGKQSDDDSATGVNWVELWSGDPDKAVAFYQAVFGHGHDQMAMPQGAYHLLKVGDKSVAGAMKSTNAKAPPMWLPYLEVDDVDAVVARARQHGGQVHADAMEVDGVGRFAIVADRQGAVAGVIRPASR